MRILILGCGYAGRATGARLVAAGHEVAGVQRGPDDGALAAAGIRPLAADVTRPDTLAALPHGWDAVVNCVSSAGGGAAAYQALYLEGTRHVLDWLHGAPPRRYLHLGSTSVYGQTDGTWVDEDAPTEPATETARVLVETEKLLAGAAARGFPAVRLRVAGIYGPGRGRLFQQLLRGEARLDGDGARWLNQVHRDDVAGAIAAALEHGRAGRLYNVADCEPVTQRDFLFWLADTLGRSRPGPAAPDEARPRRRGATNKRVSSRRLREELGWEPRFPTFREGYAEAIRAARAGGAV
ncbi:MAG TPA: SDR family oxidoreductase [Gemmatales bacterium]|nr:SDR family oxidoreductase [Gemmatales bacterium]